jgi:hypothetical protein
MIDYEVLRGWAARQLLRLVNQIDPHTRIMCDANAGWKFERDWKQPTEGSSNLPVSTGDSTNVMP